MEISSGRIWGTFRPNSPSTAIAVDPENKRVYYSDYLLKEIRSSDLNGSDDSTFITTGIALKLERRVLKGTNSQKSRVPQVKGNRQQQTVLFFSL